MATTRAPRTIDLAALINGRQLNGYNYLLIALSWLITMFDGLDMMMVSFTAPYMRDELGLTTHQLGNVFAAGTAGMVVGGLSFTYIGDRIGRRPTIIISAFSFAILTMATALATNYEQLVALRFFDGLAIGGMLPLAWALNIEFVPNKIRATIVAIIMMGFSLGSAGAAPLTNLIAPTYGWEGVYFFGGAGTLLVAAALAIWLPESPRFLVSKGLKPEVVVKTFRRLDPSVDMEPTDNFILGDEGKHKANFKVSDLFAGRLKLITPMIWLGYGASALGIFFGSNWGPSVLEALEIPRQTAAMISSVGGLLGACTGIAIMKLAERFGLIVIATIPLIVVPILLTLGFGLAPPALFVPLIVMQAMLVGGGHSAIISQLALYYPSAIRASGGGWAGSVGKIGGVMGPLLGAAVLSSGIPVVRTYAVMAACPAILFFCILGVVLVVRKPEEEEIHGQVATAH